MGLGIRIRKLWRLKLGVGISVAVALFAALWSVDRISVIPPRLAPRALAMATATTSVLVDTPESIAVDLRQNTYDLSGLVNRAVVLGSVIASPSVEAGIARQAQVPVALLRIQAPLTPAQAALQVNSQSVRKVTDVLRLNDQYRIDIVADPEVPMLNIYAQTPTAQSAGALANAAVDQLKVYLSSVAAVQGTPTKDQIRVEQLGRATGVVINPGVQWQMAVLVFILAFLLCCAARALIARVLAGWRLAALPERAADA